MATRNVTCTTPYTDLIYLSQLQLLILIVTNVIIAVWILVVNIFVIYGIIKTKQLHNKSFRLIFYLSISDCCMAIIPQSFLTFILAHDVILCQVAYASSFTASVFTHTSLYITCGIAFDRYLRMRYLQNYDHVVGNRRFRVLLFVILLLAMLPGFLYVVGIYFDAVNIADRIGIVLDILVGSSTFVIYLRTLRAVRSHRRNSSFRNVFVSVDKIMTKVVKRILLAIIFIFVPYMVFFLLYVILIGYLEGRIRSWLLFCMVLSYIFTYANSLINAIIFIFANKKLTGLLDTLLRSDKSNASSTTSTKTMSDMRHKTKSNNTKMSEELPT
ncbi:adenosine receptor A3-like [Hydractinia symbiolongicarpus]|uniref:adenosine receptor A3-like n=1 Tax=Hydractinia symbiolongicarpus TaxID=13093 RepID=UPI00254DFD98|nr:adenosine receptor A3-like [Hydractinia symbiolongicarpus]